MRYHRRRQLDTAILVTGLLLAAVVGFFYFDAIYRCREAGGVSIKNALDWPVCIAPGALKP